MLTTIGPPIWLSHHFNRHLTGGTAHVILNDTGVYCEFKDTRSNDPPNGIDTVVVRLLHNG